MRYSSRGLARVPWQAVQRGAPRREDAGRLRSTILARGIALAGIVSAAIAISATPAMALTTSHNVALIPSNVPGAGFKTTTYPTGQDGIMPNSSTTVAGNPSESFGKFSFTNVGLSQITPAELSKFDTVALIQVRTRSLSAAAKAALAQFVANGGKLLIHDADETNQNDYSWLLGGSGTTQVGAGCNDCGKIGTPPTITANSGLISGTQGDPSYVNIPEMNTYTDAVGDANLLTSTQGWFAAVTGANANGEQGAEIAYAPRGNGLAVYNGFDTDMIMPTATSPWRCIMSPNTHYICPAGAPHQMVDWLAQMWFNELNLGATPASGGGGGQSGTGLPQTTPVSSIGTPVAPSQAGLPSNRVCVAKRSLFLRLRNLIRHHRQVVQIDVYINGRHRLRERGHWHNVRLRRLPSKGNVTIKIVATTKRHYHLISKQRYHAC